MDNQLASTHDPYYSSSGLVPNLSRMATLKKNRDPVWAKVAALESSIAAVEREQEILEEAIRTKSPDFLSSQGFPRRVIRCLLVGREETSATTAATGGRQGRNLEENLRWLRKKEERLRKEKLLLMQNDVFGSPVVSHDLDHLPEEVAPNDGIGDQEDRQHRDNSSPVLRKTSYFSSPRSSSAAAAAFAAYSAALTAASVASQDSPLASSMNSRFPRRHQQQNASGIGEPEANVVPRSMSLIFRRHSSARNSTTSLNKRAGGYFSRFKGFRRISSSKTVAYSAWYKKGVGSNSGTESMDTEEEGSLREETTSWSNSDFGSQNPFWERASAQPQDKKHNHHGGASRPAEARKEENSASGVSAKVGALRKKSIWHRIFGLEDKSPEKSAGEPSPSVAWDAPQPYNVSNRSSDDETSETSSSSDNKVAVAPKGPVMMRGNVHPVAYSGTGTARQSSLRQATPPRKTAFADDASASGRKLVGTHLRGLETLLVSPNRKVRFKIPTSPLDPYYSPPASVSIGPVEMSDAMELSDIEDDEDDGDIRSLFTERGGRKHVEEATVPSTAMTRSVVRTRKITLEMVPSRRSILPRSQDREDGVTGRPYHNSRIESSPSSRAVVPPVPTHQALSSPDADFGRGTLGKVHGLLASTFALIEPEASQQRGCERAAEAIAKLTAAHTVYPSPPSSWVARYVDKSAKYGLGFLLSDGTVGVRFNDTSKIAFEAKGKAFEYVERPRRRARTRVTTGIEPIPETGDSMDHWQAPRSRHTLHDYPPGLEKKVKLLKYFRKDLRMLGGEDTSDDDLDDGGGSPATVVSPEGAGSAEQEAVVPLAVVEKWRRTRHSCLFLLSTLTVQVVFADTTQILLSDGARVVTFVDKARDRHTLTLHRVLQQQRMDIVKRLRYSKDLIEQLLTRDEHSKMSARVTIKTTIRTEEVEAKEEETMTEKRPTVEVMADEASLRE